MFESCLVQVVRYLGSCERMIVKGSRDVLAVRVGILDGGVAVQLALKLGQNGSSLVPLMRVW